MNIRLRLINLFSGNIKLRCFPPHRWYQDVKGIRSTGYGVPSEAFCIKCGRLEWEVNGEKYAPMDYVKKQLQELKN